MNPKARIIRTMEVAGLGLLVPVVRLVTGEDPGAQLREPVGLRQPGAAGEENRSECRGERSKHGRLPRAAALLCLRVRCIGALPARA